MAGSGVGQPEVLYQYLRGKTEENHENLEPEHLECLHSAQARPGHTHKFQTTQTTISLRKRTQHTSMPQMEFELAVPVTAHRYQPVIHQLHSETYFLRQLTTAFTSHAKSVKYNNPSTRSH
jgi:tripartite-type tricarboxylate transporter receptor subunit TctC